ncbi:TPA: helix-turn-helix domain-containing protein [Enterococcus faecalis]
MNESKLINKIIKQIRIDSGIKQKEARKNVVSADTYSRIENGRKDITWNELIGILQNLNISLLEFISIYGEPILTHGLRDKVRKLYYESESGSDAAQQEIINIYNRLEAQYEELPPNELAVYFDLKQIFHRKFPDKINPITKKELQEVVKLVKRKERKLYFDEDYRFISQTILDMDKKDMKLILDRLFPLKNQNLSEISKKYINNLFLNCLTPMLKARDYKMFEYILKIVKEHEFLYQGSYFYRMNLSYLECFYLFLKTNSVVELEKINDILRTLEIIGDEETANAMRTEMKEILDGKGRSKLSENFAMINKS